jgi:hypothetical protein
MIEPRYIPSPSHNYSIVEDLPILLMGKSVDVDMN